jgi:ankyrin repeat protein
LEHNKSIQKLILFGNEISLDTQFSINRYIDRNIMHNQGNQITRHSLMPSFFTKMGHHNKLKEKVKAPVIFKAAKIHQLWFSANHMPNFIILIENIKYHYEKNGHIYDTHLKRMKAFSDLHYLIANFEINEKNYDVFHVLFIRMVEEGNIKTMKAFLNNKSINPSFIQYAENSLFDQTTVLSEAAYYGHAELVKMFINAGVNCHTTYKSYTPFMWAVREGHVDVVKVFLNEKNFNDLIINENDNKKLQRALLDFKHNEASKSQTNKQKYIEINQMIVNAGISSSLNEIAPKLRMRL